MPTNTTDTTPHTISFEVESTAPHNSLFGERRIRPSLGISPSIEPVVTPQFQLQRNTQTMELRELRAAQPPDILHTDFQRPSFIALENQRESVRQAISAYRRMRFAMKAWQNLSTKEQKVFRSLLTPSFHSQQMRDIADGHTMEQQDIQEWQTMRDYVMNYRDSKDTFLRNKRRFGPIQARYNQQSAMIRQKPRVSVDIDCQAILNNVSQWENVWGISIKHFTSDNYLKIRIGIFGLTMSDSARETRYTFPAEIMLAPFIFSIRLNANGSFICESSRSNAIGLSRQSEPGRMYYDFHPHQLSDTPCFGTFGQSFIDMANLGEIIPLIGGIIGFYGQYNSQDSAGIQGLYYHPTYLQNIQDETSYLDYMIEKMSALGRFNVIHGDKLQQAISDYMSYHETERHSEQPELLNVYRCFSCNETPVSDDTEYCINAHDERICPECWNDHYCGECERHVDDCFCDATE